MHLIKRDDKIVAVTRYEERQVCKQAGFRWNPEKKYWWTSDPSKAAKLIEYADQEVRQEIEAALETLEKNVAASRATNADVVIPHPEGLSYMPFQKAGIAYAAERLGTLIADEMGLGKTIQALGLINLDDSIRSILVICPASLRLNWKREAEKWIVRPLSMGIVDSKLALPNTDIVIINFDIVHKFREDLRDRSWDLLIVDEAHYLKNRKARRTAEVLGKKKRKEWEVQPIQTHKKLFMTGTPILNKPIELWPLINALDPDTWTSYDRFTKRYCCDHNDGCNWNVSGTSSLSKLQERLRQTIMVRRLKSQVLSDLPAKLRQVIPLPADGARKVVDRELQAWDGHQKRINELRIAVELSKASEYREDYESAVSDLRVGMSVAFKEMSALRHATAVAKTPYVLAHLADVSNKIVVFPHHKDVIFEIKDRLGDTAVALTGETSMADRQLAVDRFQTDPDVRYFIGSITAAGVGITLTAASHVVFAELDWVPGNVTQAEDRCHRIGQENSVLVQHLVFDESLDARMAQVLVDKQRVIDRTLDDEFVKAEPVTVAQVATRNLSWQNVAKQSISLSEAEVSSIQEGLRLLAGVCDGARMRDMAGFNALDTRIGKSLAMLPRLTNKQAVLGLKILRRYSRQLPSEIVSAIATSSDPNQP
jgi:SNF2 family DNA or RNA helicase